MGVSVLDIAAGLVAARMYGFGALPAADLGLPVLGRSEFPLSLDAGDSHASDGVFSIWVEAT